MRSEKFKVISISGFRNRASLQNYLSFRVIRRACVRVVADYSLTIIMGDLWMPSGTVSALEQFNPLNRNPSQMKCRLKRTPFGQVRERERESERERER